MGTLTTRINKGRLWSACVGILSVGFVSSLLIPSVFSSASASAESVGSSTLSVRVKDVISIRILNDTGTNSISTLGIDIAPTPNGSTITKNAIVDVATSNETGYTLYMDSDYKEDGTSSSTTPETQSTYTTDLIHTDPTITVTIPSSVPSSSSDTNFWNYKVGSGNATIIPTHGTPDTIRDDITEPSDSSMTTIGINVNVNNDIPSGTYKNKLVFTAVANELPPALPDFWNITTMQEMTPEICSSVYTPNNTVSMTDEYIIDKSRALAGDYTAESDGTSPLVPEVTLLDDRDADGTGTKKSYKVRKLADGNCWMVENLEYDLLALYNNGKRGIGSKNDGSTFEMTDESLATGVAGYYDVTTANAYNYVINQNTKPLTDITRQSYLGNVTGQTEYYYNWTAATAGQGSQSDATANVSIDGSICPAGWRLPTSYTDTINQNVSWGALTKAYLGTTANLTTSVGYRFLDQYPISLYRAGIAINGSYGSNGYGFYWSSTAYNANIGYNMYYHTSYVYPQNNSSNKSNGFQLRCVANPAPPKTIWQIETMQEMTPAICATTTTPTFSATTLDTDGSHIGDTSYVPQNTLTDTRDNNTYIVRKLADGNCWMAENLRAINTELAADQSDNLASNFTLPASALVNYSNGNSIAYAYTDPIANAGVLYSWYAAVGGTSTATSDLATGSICPKGWELPRDTGDRSMQNMVGTVYGGSSNVSIMRNSPISMPATGMIINGSYTPNGGWGNNYSIHYTAQSSATNNAWVVIGASNRVDLRYSHPVTYTGFSVRCVAK